MNDKATQLYRHFDADGQLLYVGISMSAWGRCATHMRRSGWSGQSVRMTIQHFPNRADAKAAETLAITTENPLWNVKEMLWQVEKPASQGGEERPN